MASLEILLEELRGFRQETKEHLSTIKEEIRKANARISEVEERLGKTEERAQNTEEVVTELLKLHMSLDDKLVDLESRTRRENVRIYGVPEGAEKDCETVAAFVETLFKEGLGLEDSGLDMQIERAHRELGPQPPEGAPPRSIVVKFQSFKVKERLLREAWQRKGFVWCEKRINLDHDYPPAILRKRREYTEARRVLKENGVPFQTLFPARLRVKYKEGSKTYDTVEETTEDLAKRGYKVKVIRSPASLKEQIERLSWSRKDGGKQKGSFRSTRAENYKERLRAFRRTSPPAT
uniref:L1 transposable element RRM domain-containing protein n=1 Tax=Fundulus heteroclitus TaxID=8078 RepID=Q64IX7_FUNHE|nr:unknown [Fundulus heteroclitus]